MSQELIEQLRTAEATGEEFGIPASGSLYQMARIELERLQADADRFEWWFSDTDKGNFLNTYMQGMRERWDLNHWRAAIDAARPTSSVPETSPPSRQGEDPEA